MICKKCGVVLNDADNFCSRCGEAVASESEIAVDSKRSKTALVLAVLSVAIFGVDYLGLCAVSMAYTFGTGVMFREQLFSKAGMIAALLSLAFALCAGVLGMLSRRFSKVAASEGALPSRAARVLATIGSSVSLAWCCAIVLIILTIPGLKMILY